MRLHLHSYQLPLRHTFTIARESTQVQSTLVVELEQGGLRGFGEATTNPYYGATIEKMTAALRAVESELEQISWEEPADLWDRLDPVLGHNRFAQCALDQAAHDLWGKRVGQPVFRLWGLDSRSGPVSNYTIGIDTIETMVDKLNEFPGWPIYKIKLGTDEDLEIVRALRRHTDATFRVDANCGWTAEQTIRYSEELAALGVEFIEQPLPPDQGPSMVRVKTLSALPLIADESCQQVCDVARCGEQFDGVNIKLVKCGGMTPARRMIDEARRLGLKTMVGCMTESTVGISAIAQLRPMLDYVDMDGAVLLAEDVARGVHLERGVCHYPADVPGNGVTLTRQ